MQVDSSTTRGDSRGMGSLLLKKEFKEAEVEEELELAPIELCGPLQVEEITVGFIRSGQGALFCSLLRDLLNTNSSL